MTIPPFPKLSLFSPAVRKQLFMLTAIWFIITIPLLFIVVLLTTKKRNIIVRLTAIIPLLTLSLFAAINIFSAISPSYEPDTARGASVIMNINLIIIILLIPATAFLLLMAIRSLLKSRHRLITTIIKAFNTLWIASAVLLIAGFLHGRFNFSIERITIKIDNLPHQLENLTIVHTSDLHLGSFHKYSSRLEEMTAIVNSLKPDLIFDTGDFITLGHREFGMNDTILAKQKAKYGKYAVLGNHDIGTYLPNPDEEEIKTTINNVAHKIKQSGYTLLNNESVTITINGADIAIAGVETRGRHPDIIHFHPDNIFGDTSAATLRIMLSHDPNHWDKIRELYPETDITLAGHTHGMQFGLRLFGKRRSLSAQHYPRWNGLYSDNSNHLYVNRGTGVLGLPLRVGMPPEITVITLK